MYFCMLFASQPVSFAKIEKPAVANYLINCVIINKNCESFLSLVGLICPGGSSSGGEEVLDRLMANLERLIPQALAEARLRYRALREILYNQPIGRRQIAMRLGCSERSARSLIAAFKEQGVLEVTPGGIVLTDYGLELVHMVDEVIPYLDGLNSLALRLQERLNLDMVLVVPGDSYYDPYSKKDLGRVAARYFRDVLPKVRVVAVSGGTTLAEMGNAIPSGTARPDVLVLPARGGLGEKVEEQANTIAAHIAESIGGHYRLLHVPDNLEEETMKILLANHQIAEIVAQLKQCDLLIHGIGSALEMASRRGLVESAVKTLEEKKAVGEAFRYYFDASGDIVYSVTGIGLELSDLKNIPIVVAVAGGSNKARAIEAVLRNRGRGTLITDEGAARAILEGRQ